MAPPTPPQMTVTTRNHPHPPCVQDGLLSSWDSCDSPWAIGNFISWATVKHIAKDTEEVMRRAGCGRLSCALWVCLPQVLSVLEVLQYSMLRPLWFY